MSLPRKVIVAEFNDRDNKCVTGPLWQYDYGQVLQIHGIDLPPSYEVHFSNSPHGKAKTVIGDETGVKIPDEYLVSGASVFAWLFLHAGDDDGSTVFQIEILVRRKAKPTDASLTPIEHDTISKIISDMKAAAGEAEQARGDAVSAKESAEQARDDAEEFARLAQMNLGEVGFVHFEIDDAGDLIMKKSTNITAINFTLEEGDLIYHGYYE